MPRVTLLAFGAALALATGCGVATHSDGARATARPHPAGSAPFSEGVRVDLDAVSGAFRDLHALLQHRHSNATYAASAAPIVATFAHEKSRLDRMTPPTGLAHQFATVRSAVDAGLSAARAVAGGTVNGGPAERAHLAGLLHRIAGAAGAFETVAAAAGLETAVVPGAPTLPAAVPTATGGGPATGGSASPGLTQTTWSAVSYPFDCSPVGYLVERARYADLNGDGALDAVVLVRCDAGAGNPPVALYAFDGASSPARPRLMATLISPAADRLAPDFTISGATVTIDTFGYSSQAVPRCCPDERFRMSWHWQGSTYTAESSRLP